MLKQLLGGSAARNARPNAHREATKRSSKFIVLNFTTHKLPYPSDSWLCLYSAAQTALLQQPTLAPSWQLAGASARRLKLHPPLVFSFSGLSEKVFSEGFHTNPHTRRLLGLFRAWLAVHLARFFSILLRVLLLHEAHEQLIRKPTLSTTNSWQNCTLVECSTLRLRTFCG